jgi:hypothetical protein
VWWLGSSRVSSSSWAPQRSIHHQVCVLHLIFVCVCVCSACVFVSASHSDSRCGVFHTTKLFDSGFPKVSEDIFFFPPLFRKVWWTFFFLPLHKKFRHSERLYTVKNNSKKEREREKKPDSCLPWRPLLCLVFWLPTLFFCACVFSFIPHFKEICIFSTYFFSSLGGPFRKKKKKV